MEANPDEVIKALTDAYDTLKVENEWLKEQFKIAQERQKQLCEQLDALLNSLRHD